MATNISVWAAMSLRNVFNDPAFLAALATATNSQVTITPTFDSSGVLADRILAGTVTRPDVFMSAATDQMQRLVTSIPSLVTSGNVVQVLRNNLVLIKNRAAGLPVPIDSFGNVDAVHTVTPGTVQIYIAATQTYKVPAGYYAQQAFQYFGSAVWNWISTAANATITSMNTVAAVLAAVAASNNAPAIGAVYATEASSYDIMTPPVVPNPVEIIAVAPAPVNINIIYPAAPLSASPNLTAAQQFVNFLASSAAWPSFQKWGFIPISAMP